MGDEFIKAKIEEYKPQIIEALNKFQEDVEDYKDFIIEEAKKIHVRIDKFRVQIMEDANDVYEKARAAAEKLNGDVRDYVLAKIEELKPQGIEGLNKARTVVIDGAKKIYLQVKDKIVRIITGATSAVSGSEAYGIKDKLKGAWEKVKEAAKNLAGKVKTIVLEIIDENNPLIMEQLNKMKEALIKAGKTVIIRIVNDVAEIIVGDNVVESDETYMAKRGFNDLWEKVKAAAANLDDKIKAEVQEMIEHYKPKIIKGLETVKQVIIESGKKIVITIRDEIVDIIAGDDVELVESDPQMGYGFKDKMKEIWEKVKGAAKKLGSKTKEIVMKIVQENKPFIMEQLNKIKEALINAGKKVLIQITDDIVKIIVGDSAGSSYSGLEKRGITDIWNQVKNAVKSAAEKVQDYLNDKMDVLKPKIMDALANAKADLNGFKEVVIDGAKKLYVKATAKGVEIIADLKGVWAKVEAALKDAQAKADEFIKAKIEEYKPQIIEALNKFQEDVEDYKDFVIEESKKIYVRINKFGVQVVEDANNVWDKVEAAVKDFSADVDEFVKAEIEKYKPRIIEALNKFRDDVEDYKDFVIDEAKKIHVRIDKFRVQIMEDANDVN